METIQLIVECTMDEQRERIIESVGEVKYRLPMINSYVIEVQKSKVDLLNGIKGIKAIYQSAEITAQMNVARKSINADIREKHKLTGKGVTIAILDTGVSAVDDLTLPKNRILVFKDFVNGKAEAYDDNAHGTHVAGIAAGNGVSSKGRYTGIAPESSIVAVKILDKDGRGNSSDVLGGLQWVLDNKERYNIRIINLSIGTADIGSADPLVRAVEAAWDMGIVVVIAAGNRGPSSRTVTSPGTSRKVITAGASDDNKSVMIWGSTLINFSGRGPTSECIMKPDIIAPGTDIISCLTKTNLTEKRQKEINIVDKSYVKMSGTSMSTPIVSGAIALLIEKYPEITPDEVKYRLKSSVKDMSYSQNQQGWGLIDISKLLQGEIEYVRKYNL